MMVTWTRTEMEGRRLREVKEAGDEGRRERLWEEWD